MKVFLQTRMNSPVTVYDTDAPESVRGKTNAGKFIMGILKPYIKVQEGNVIMYEYGKPYPDESMKWQFLIGLTGALMVAGGASLIFGLGRASK